MSKLFVYASLFVSFFTQMLTSEGIHFVFAISSNNDSVTKHLFNFTDEYSGIVSRKNSTVSPVVAKKSKKMAGRLTRNKTVENKSLFTCLCFCFSKVTEKIKIIKCPLYSHCAEACNEWRDPSPRLSAWATQSDNKVGLFP